MEAPKQPRLLYREIRSTTVGGCRHANVEGLEQGDSISLRAIVGAKPGKTTHLATLREIVILQMDWPHGEVEMGNEQHKAVRSRRMMERYAARQIADVVLYFAGSSRL